MRILMNIRKNLHNYAAHPRVHTGNGRKSPTVFRVGKQLSVSRNRGDGPYR